MAYTTYLDIVQKVYIAFFQRPADPQGLRYWAQRLDEAGGDLTTIIEAYTNAPETVELYGGITADTIGDVIAKIYQGLFGRDPEPEGLAYYIEGFAEGRFTPGAIALDILNGANNEDKEIIANKVQAAHLFTELISGHSLTDPEFGQGNDAATYIGAADAHAAREMLSSVTDDAGSVPGRDTLTDLIQETIADPGDPIIPDPMPEPTPDPEPEPAPEPDPTPEPIPPNPGGGGDPGLPAPVFNAAHTVGMDSSNKTATISFTSGAVTTNAGTLDALKAAIKVSTDGVTFHALGAADTVAITAGKLVITFDTATTSNTLKFQIAGNTLKSANGAANTAFTTTALDNMAPGAAQLLPVIVYDLDNSGGFSAGDQIILTFSEHVDKVKIGEAILAIHNLGAGPFGASVQIEAVDTPLTHGAVFAVTIGTGTTIVAGNTLTIPKEKIVDAAGNQALQDINFSIPAATGTFFVTEIAPGIWRPATGFGDVVINENATNFVFTSTTGGAFSVPKAGPIGLVVDTIALSGEINILTQFTNIAGTGTVAIPNVASGNVILSHIATGINFSGNTLSIAEAGSVIVNAGSITGATLEITGVAEGLIETFQIIGTANDDVINLSNFTTDANTSIIVTGHDGADTITLSSTAVEHVFYTQSDQGDTTGDTINSFDPAQDKLAFLKNDFGGTTVNLAGVNSGITALDGSSGAKADLDSLPGSFNGVIRISDNAAADWNDVATIANAALTGTNNGINAIVLIDNGTDTKMYYWSDTTENSQIDTGELTLLGTLLTVSDATAVSALLI